MAYEKNDQNNNIEAINNINQINEIYDLKQIKKINRKLRISSFFWRYFIYPLSPRGRSLKKGYRKRGIKEVRW